MIAKIARKLAQLGFLGLFLYPFVPLVYRRLTYRPAPVMLSWLLAWDPLLFLSRLSHPGLAVLVVGAPLLLVALTFVGGRAFCGWVCPLGTLLDLVGPLLRQAASLCEPLARWLPRPRRLQVALTLPDGNSYVKHLLAIAVLAGSLLSLKLAGLLDPLVLFQRLATMTVADWFALRSPGFDIYVAISLLFLGILILEVWRPRFWCRHLCPQGALLGWLSRWTLLNRRVSAACNHCAKCRVACPMHAIPKEAHETNYQECHFCLECEAVCPEKAVSFAFGPLAWARWQAGQPQPLRLRELGYRRALAWVRGLGGETQPHPASQPGAPRFYPGTYVAAERSRLERILGLKVGRRGLVAGLAAGAGSLALWPLLRLGSAPGLIRPPGALPEDEFLATCILCQECIRICPAQALKPAFLEGGLRALGTPFLAPRVGGCQLKGSCPDLCARVCPVGAIQPLTADRMKLGRARVDHRTCLAWDQAARCLVCLEACPASAAVAHQGRVTVDPALCTGCGICEQSCPVQGSAIHVTLEGEVRYRRV